MADFIHLMELRVLAFLFGGHADEMLLSLFIIFAAAKLSAEIFERLKQPAVVGEILAGVLIGPSVLGLVNQTEVTRALAEIGVILLLFTVGLEVNPKAILKVGKNALLIAVLGVILPFVAGYCLLTLWGAPTIERFFLGAAMVATSVGITARVLAAMNKLSTKASQIILAAAVIDDILGLLVLGVVSSMAKGKINYVEIIITATLSIGFTLFILFAGTKIAQKTKPQVDYLRIGHAFFIVGLILCFGLSLLATIAGVAGIIGAFLAGMALAEVSEDTDLHHQTGAVMEFLLPFFLVGIGLQLELSVFRNGSVIILALLTTLIAVMTKLIGCGLPAISYGKRTALQIGMGMVPRGEVGIIVAQLGLSLGVLSGALYGIVVFMAVATTLIAPPFLIPLFRSSQPDLSNAQIDTIIEPEQPFSELQ
ncbi:MAG: cation:proton antiporter [Acidobacteriota bacterium]